MCDNTIIHNVFMTFYRSNDIEQLEVSLRNRVLAWMPAACHRKARFAFTGDAFRVSRAPPPTSFGTPFGHASHGSCETGAVRGDPLDPMCTLRVCLGAPRTDFV